MEGEPRHGHARSEGIGRKNESAREADLDALLGAAALTVMAWGFIGWVAWAGVFEPWMSRGVLPSGSIIAALFLFALGPAVVSVGMWPKRVASADPRKHYPDQAWSWIVAAVRSFRQAKRLAIAKRFARGLRASLGPRIRSVELFGSVARGEDRGASDIDLLVEVSRRTPRVERVIFESVAHVVTEDGELIVPLVLSTAERRRHLPHYLASAIKREGLSLV